MRAGSMHSRHRTAAKSVWIPALALLLLFAAFSAASCTRREARDEDGHGRVFDGCFLLYVPMGEDDPRTIGARHFAELLDRYSDGKLRCDVKTGTVLGSDADLIKKMIADTGEVDMFVVSTGFFGEYTDANLTDIPAMPYMLTDFEMAWAFADSDLMAEFEKDLPKENIRVIGHFCGGFRCMTNSRRPIETPEDLEGLVIRTPAGSMVMDLVFALNAKAMPLPFAELYDALQKGYYDGQENPPSIIYNNKLYEAQKYLSITNHNYMLQSFAVAESIWQQLTEEEQEIVLRALREAETYERELSRSETNRCIERLKEEGMEVNYPDLSRFAEATEEFRHEESMHFEAGYEAMRQWLEEYRRTHG